MTINPVGNKIYLQMDEVKKVGDLSVESKKTIREVATVLARGPEVGWIKVGDRILVKAWGIDTITHEKQDYFFVSETSDAICAVITE